MFVQGGALPRGSLSSWGSVSGGVSVQGSLSRGVSVQGRSLSETPHMVTSRRYASYWNAFLFSTIFAENGMKTKEFGSREGHA